MRELKESKPVTEEDNFTKLMEIDPSEISNSVFRRLITEVKRDAPDSPNRYNRFHNRHNR